MTTKLLMSDSHSNKNKGGGVELEDSISFVVNHSGRVSSLYLKNIALATELESFLKFVGQPVLAGGAIRDGTLVKSLATAQAPFKKRGRTLAFKPAEFLRNEVRNEADADPIQRAIYALVKGPESATPDPYHFTIGREMGRDLVIPDFTISHAHAEIRLKLGRYFLTDLNSSNGTYVNGQQVTEKPVEIKDKDIITFARIDLCVFFPETLYALLREKKSA